MLYSKMVLLFFFVMLGINLLVAAIRGEDWLKLGRQSIALQNFDLAIHYFSNEIRDNPRNAFAYLERAKAYRLKGEIVKSAEDKQKAYQLDPDLIKRVYLPDNAQSGNRRPIQSPL
ncbi:MAG: hypothetical protein RIM99_13325 [Cyclobacteriaceae bacterium]